MDKLTKQYKKYMFRPIAYKCVTKASIVLALCLLWDRFLNTSGELHMTDYVFPIAGIVLLGCSWFQYLSLDGFHIIRWKRTVKRKKHHPFRSMIDYTEEEVVSFADLEPEERTACNFASNIIVGGIYLGIAAVTAILRM